MGVLLFLIALASLNVFLNEQTWYLSSAFCQMLDALFPFILPMAFGPLLYFYVQATLEPGFVLKRRHFLHFLPVLIDLFPYVFAAGYLIGIWVGWLPDHTGRAGRIIDKYNVYADIPRWISLTGYIVAAGRYLHPRRERRGAAWIRECLWVFGAFQVLWLVYLVPYVIPRYTYWLLDRFHWYPLFLPLSLITYWFGLKGFTVVYPRIPAKADDFDAKVALLRRAMEDGGLRGNIPVRREYQADVFHL